MLTKSALTLLAMLAMLAVAVIISVRVNAEPDGAAYKDASLDFDQRVNDLLSRMTADEKTMGIPAIKMADGPIGVRNWRGSSAVTNAASTVPVTSTAFPAGIGMASSWDLELVAREGRAIAQEVKALGRDMILGPTVNINRVPLWGRNFEGYGEDPYLAARMGLAYIKAVQAEGVIPSVKHFAI